MKYTDVCHSIDRLLRKRAFAGFYTERRLVDSLGEYRDVVWLAPDEHQIAEDFAAAGLFYKNIFSNGFASYTDPSASGAPAAPSLWVQLEDLPFGCHWFQIKSINLGSKEISYVLEHLRSLPNVSYDKQNQQSITKNLANEAELQNLFESFVPSVKDFIYNISKDDFKNVLKFTLVLITTLVTGLFHVVKFTGDFTLRFVREASFFIHNSTPVFLGILDFCSKIVGGLYILLAMLWRGKSQPQPRHYEPIQYYPTQNQGRYKYQFD